ncbi:MAG: SH3 domain-containing protein [Thermodesulfobacteriota bacterium]|nr:SH3 domain-containing protein [Thermodesulfobacteriota bacterium]
MRRIPFFVVLAIVLWTGQASAKRLAVNVGKANVRSGPGTNHDIMWSVGKYYPLDVLKKSGSWYKVRDFEDDEGWIHRSLVEKIPAVTVKAPLVNVREGPGTTFRVLLQAEKGVSFKRLDRKGTWFKVQHQDGEVGWIHQSLVWGY